MSGEICRIVAGEVCLLSIAELPKEGPEVARKPVPTMASYQPCVVFICHSLSAHIPQTQESSPVYGMFWPVHLTCQWTLEGLSVSPQGRSRFIFVPFCAILVHQPLLYKTVKLSPNLKRGYLAFGTPRVARTRKEIQKWVSSALLGLAPLLLPVSLGQQAPLPQPPCGVG